MCELFKDTITQVTVKGYLACRISGTVAGEQVSWLDWLVGSNIIDLNGVHLRMHMHVTW